MMVEALALVAGGVDTQRPATRARRVRQFMPSTTRAVRRCCSPRACGLNCLLWLAEANRPRNWRAPGALGRATGYRGAAMRGAPDPSALHLTRARIITARPAALPAQLARHEGPARADAELGLGAAHTQFDLDTAAMRQRLLLGNGHARAVGERFRGAAPHSLLIGERRGIAALRLELAARMRASQDRRKHSQRDSPAGTCGPSRVSEQ